MKRYRPHCQPRNAGDWVWSRDECQSLLPPVMNYRRLMSPQSWYGSILAQANTLQEPGSFKYNTETADERFGSFFDQGGAMSAQPPKTEIKSGPWQPTAQAPLHRVRPTNRCMPTSGSHIRRCAARRYGNARAREATTAS